MIIRTFLLEFRLHVCISLCIQLCIVPVFVINLPFLLTSVTQFNKKIMSTYMMLFIDDSSRMCPSVVSGLSSNSLNIDRYFIRRELSSPSSVVSSLEMAHVSSCKLAISTAVFFLS